MSSAPAQPADGEIAGRGTFRAMRVPNYRRYAAANLVSQTGTWMQRIGQDWLVLQISDGSGVALGITTALQFGPSLFSMVGGVLADRYDKRRLLMITQSVMGVLALLLGTLVATDVIALWHVYVLAGGLGVVAAVDVPIRQSFVSELVGTSLLPNALSLSAAVFNSARILGPAMAGVSIAWFGLGPVFLYSTVLAVVPVWTYARMRPDDLLREIRPPLERRRPTRISDGLRYVWRRADLLLPLSLMGVVGMIGFNFPVTLAALAKTGFQTGAASFGLFNTALAVGALGGALAGSGRRSRPSSYVVLGAAVAFGGLEILVGFGPTFWLVATLLVPTGFFMIYFAQAANQRVQLGTEAAYRGRVMALYILVFLGTTPLGAPVAGWLAERYGAGVSIWLGGVVSLAVALAALVVKLRSSRDRIRVRLRPAPRLYVCREAETPEPVLGGAG